MRVEKEIGRRDTIVGSGSIQRLLIPPPVKSVADASVCKPRRDKELTFGR